MEELKKKITQLRKMMFTKDFRVGHEQKAENALKLEIKEMMKEEPNKQKLAKIWNNEFTGNYSDD